MKYIFNKSMCFISASLFMLVFAIELSYGQEQTERADFSDSPSIRARIVADRDIYYPGDALDITIVATENVQRILAGDVDVHIVLISPNGRLVSIALGDDIGAEARSYFSLDFVDTRTLSPGLYQIALIATIPRGDPENIRDWYHGFFGLMSAVGVYISDGPVEGDRDNDGLLDDGLDWDGLLDVLDFDRDE